MSDSDLLRKYEKLQQELATAQEALKQHEDFAERVTQVPKAFAIVIRVEPSTILYSNGTLVEVETPSKAFKLKPGARVTVLSQTMQIVAASDFETGGMIRTVASVVDGDFITFGADDGARLVFSNGHALEAGDSIVVEGDIIVTRKMPKIAAPFQVRKETGVTWDDIGGLKDAKAAMREAIELPHANPKIFERYGLKPPKGILLYGPPGCGKTMLGKAAATALAKLHGGHASDDGFLYVKGPEVLDRYVGVAEASIRSLFDRARRFKAETGMPAVLFIDEADALLGRRGASISADMERTIVPMFLTEMDGLEESAALTILATNRPDTLDPAVVRDGRIDRKIKIERPDVISANTIFEINLKNAPLADDEKVKKVAAFAAAELFSAKRALFRIETEAGEETLTLSHLVNGALVAGIVQQAKSMALQRDLASGKATGITRDDIAAALDATARQNRDVDHRDAILDLVGERRVLAVRTITDRIAA